ncbi:hypothetical protein JCM8208_007397 [Rhodotorula glutinis]
MDDSGITKGKAMRSRAACDPCRLVKQKCDGPSMIPCRRCMLYSLPCTYAVGAPAGQKKTAKVTTALGAPTQPLHQGHAQLDTSTNTLLHDMAARLRSIESAISSLHLSSLSATSSSSRQPTASYPSGSPENGPSPRDIRHPSGSDRGGEPEQGAARATDVGETAVQAINDAVELLHKVASSGLAAFPAFGEDGLNSRVGGGKGGGNGHAGSSTAKYDEGLIARILQSEGWTRPDVLDRGVMTVQEVEKTFEIFFSRLAPWTPFFASANAHTHAIPELYSPQAVRERSPLLLHTILLSTAYFLLRAPGEHSKRVYLGLTGIVNELVAPVVISMSRRDVTTDTARAFLLLVMWKSVQHAHFVSTTSSSPTSSAERYYKNNAVSSASLWVLETHLLRSLRLQSTAPHAFAAAVQHAAARGRQFDSAHVASDPAAQHAVDDLRLWYWALVADVHGALTTGRALHFSSGETALALRTVRALAGFNLQASDVRLAALVELYEVVREAMRSEWAFTGDSVGAAGPSSCRWKPEWEGEMDEFNRRIDAWEDDWVGRLKAAFVGSETGKEGDKIAWSALGNKHLCKTILNASVFYRWTRTRRLAVHDPPSTPLAGDPSAPPASPPHDGTVVASDLSPAEWRFIQTTVDAVERLVFDVSVESRVVVPGRAYDGSRQVQWPAPDVETGLRTPLTVDSTVAEATKTSHDPVSCVGIVYPLILLSKICNSGLSRCELATLDKPHNSTMSSPHPPTAPSPSTTSGTQDVPVRLRAVLPGRKLAVLLSLGAAFLDQVAPTPAHPAAVHAKTLRLILKAGMWGQDGEQATAQAQDEAIERASRGAAGAGQASPPPASPFSSAAQLLSAVLAQVTPSSPPPELRAQHVGPSTGFPLERQFTRPSSSTSTSRQLAARPPPAAAFSAFVSSAPSLLGGPAEASTSMSAFPTSPFGQSFSTTSASPAATAAATTFPFLYPPSVSSPNLEPPQPPSTMPSHLVTSTSFPSFEGFPHVAGSVAGVGLGAPAAPHAGHGMEVDVDALGALDWSALETQLGMESGSLSEGFGGGGGGAATGIGAQLETAYGDAVEQLDWMSY